MEVPLAEAEEAHQLGYFFKTAGAARFSEAASTYGPPGYAVTLVVAERYSVVVFSDMQGGCRKSTL